MPQTEPTHRSIDHTHTAAVPHTLSWRIAHVRNVSAGKGSGILCSAIPTAPRVNLKIQCFQGVNPTTVGEDGRAGRRNTVLVDVKNPVTGEVDYSTARKHIVLEGLEVLNPEGRVSVSVEDLAPGTKVLEIGVEAVRTLFETEVISGGS